MVIQNGMSYKKKFDTDEGKKTLRVNECLSVKRKQKGEKHKEKHKMVDS